MMAYHVAEGTTLSRTAQLGAAAAALFVLTLSLGAQAPADRFWPQWRGPQMSGVSPSASPPAQWSESKNVRWKV
jgi:hypothetical protein